MKKITVKAVRKFDPCFDPIELDGIQDNSKMTLLEAMGLGCVDDADKIWLASRFMTKLQCRIFAIWCAKRCKTDAKEIKDYIKAIEAYYITKKGTKKEMLATYWAYRAAYWAADRAADKAAECKVQVNKIKKILKERL